MLSDLYKPHTREELEALVRADNLAPDVYAKLDPERTYGIQWYNRQRTETVYGPEGERRVNRDRPRAEWIAVPVEDAGIPPAWVEAARKGIENRVRPSNAGHRAWMLKGYIRCACGSALTPMTANPNKVKRYFYYACEKERKHGKGSCPYAHYHKAEETEERVAAFVLGLAHNPETFRKQIEAEAAREKAALRDTRKHVAALAHRLAEADSERDRLVRLYTRES